MAMERADFRYQFIAFLEEPDFPFASSSKRTSYTPFRFPKLKGFSVRFAANGSFSRGYSAVASAYRRCRPRTSRENSGTRFTGIGAKYSSILCRILS